MYIWPGPSSEIGELLLFRSEKATPKYKAFDCIVERRNKHFARKQRIDEKGFSYALFLERDYVTFGSLLSQIYLSSHSSVVCRLSVCLQPSCALYSKVGTFVNISSPFRTLAILWPPCKILWRSSQGNPSFEGVRRQTGSEIDWCHVRLFHLLMSLLCHLLLIY